MTSTFTTHTGQWIVESGDDPLDETLERLEQRRAKVHLHLKLALIDVREWHGDDWRDVVQRAVEEIDGD